METGEGDALLAFLTSRLDTLGREDRPQSTMVATWLTELLLDRVNRAMLNSRDPEGAAECEQVCGCVLKCVLEGGHMELQWPGVAWACGAWVGPGQPEAACVSRTICGWCRTYAPPCHAIC